MLVVRHLHCKGLPPLDLSIPPGSCLAIMGPSGVGKSLLLRALADLDPNEGTVRLGQIDRAATPAPDWRRQVVYVPADSGWWTETVGGCFSDLSAVAALLPNVGLPPDSLDWPITRLSTGERQRLALLRALTLPRRPGEARAYLLDEPTSGLDAETTKRVEALLIARKDPATAMIVVTHDEAQAHRLGDSVMILSKDGLRTQTEAAS